MQNKIVVDNQKISIIKEDYISLTDMVRNLENGLVLIEKWLRNKNTIEFIGIWEKIYNSDFNSLEFEGIKNEAGLNRFSLSVKMWINKTNKQWKEVHPKQEGNMRDYATAEQLVVLANLENLNAQFIKQGISSQERLLKLNEVAIEQLQLLLKYTKKLGK